MPIKKFNSLCCLVLLCLSASSCYTLRGLKWQQPDLDDVEKFKSVTIPASSKHFTFLSNLDNQEYTKLKKYLDTFLLNSNTNAFVVIKRDTIVYEYYNNQSSATLHPSFSIAKSFVGTLIGIAVDKQLIKSTNDPVISYLPQLSKNDKRLKMLTIQHVLDMRASIDFDEHQETMFGSITRLYYGRSLKEQVNRLRLKADPGSKFEYQSICTQVLSAILEKASGKKVEVLLGDWLWQPLGMESDAVWSTDDQHAVKASCCLNATALDFAKLGRLYLHNGEWQGRQILSESWVTATSHPDTLMQKGYKNQWWGVANYKYFKDSAQAVNYKQQKRLSSSIVKNERQFYMQVPSKGVTNYKFFKDSAQAFNYKQLQKLSGNIGKNWRQFNIKVPSNEFEAVGILQQIIYVNRDNGVVIVRLGNEPPYGKINFPDTFIPDIGKQL